MRAAILPALSPDPPPPLSPDRALNCRTMEQLFTGKVALVTGASRGIGRAVASRLAAQGAQVVGSARSEASLGTLASELNKFEKHFAAAAGDLRDAKFCETLPAKCIDHFGRLDILVNNAGINHVGTIESLPLEAWEETLKVNLTAPFLLTKAALPFLKASGAGVIINISSVSAKMGLPKFAGFAAYCASKYGLQGLTDVTYTEAKALGVRVVCVQPGSTDTDLLQKTMPGVPADLSPADVAQVVAFLASDQAQKINGATIEVFP